ncbi:unnamed protein product [Rhizopus stolonifer]
MFAIVGATVTVPRSSNANQLSSKRASGHCTRMIPQKPPKTILNRLREITIPSDTNALGSNNAPVTSMDSSSFESSPHTLEKIPVLRRKHLHQSFVIKSIIETRYFTGDRGGERVSYSRQRKANSQQRTIFFFVSQLCS